jgi:hypothetical protein
MQNCRLIGKTCPCMMMYGRNWSLFVWARGGVGQNVGKLLGNRYRPSGFLPGRSEQIVRPKGPSAFICFSALRSRPAGIDSTLSVWHLKEVTLTRKHNAVDITYSADWLGNHSAVCLWRANTFTYGGNGMVLPTKWFPLSTCTAQVVKQAEQSMVPLTSNLFVLRDRLVHQ